MTKATKTDADAKDEAASTPSRAERLFAVAHRYGRTSFDNYARIRSLAETLRDGFDAWLSDDGPYVFLVPPEGRFSSKNYQSAAFSVAGKGYLPLKPISFGLAVRVSEDEDFMRVKIECHKEGGKMQVSLHNGPTLALALPETDDGALDAAALEPLYHAIYTHLIDFFQNRLNDYDDGQYAGKDIGFDLQRMTQPSV